MGDSKTRNESTHAVVNPMYAIISDGGKQYRVEEGQEFDVDFREV